MPAQRLNGGQRHQKVRGKDFQTLHAVIRQRRKTGDQLPDLRFLPASALSNNAVNMAYQKRFTHPAAPDNRDKFRLGGLQSICQNANFRLPSNEVFHTYNSLTEPKVQKKYEFGSVKPL